MENSNPPLKPAVVKRMDPDGIEVRVIRVERDTDKILVQNLISLRQMLNNYMFVLGYENAHAQLLSILVALMTTGKVRVEFRAHIERLQLKEPTHTMNRNSTLQLFHEYLASVNQAEKVVSGSESTQKIVVQPPRMK